MLAVLPFWAACHTLKVTQEVNIQVAENAGKDSVAMQFLKPWTDSLQKFTSGFVAYTDSAILHKKPTGPLGNLCADLLLRFGDSALQSLGKPNCDAAIMNHGGLRNSLPAGTISVGDIYELMPFENEVVLLKIRGTAMDSLLQHIVSRGGEPIAGAGIKYSKEKGLKAVLRNIPFDSRREYWIVTSDYLAQGGDAFFMLLNPLERIDTRVTVREMLIRGMLGENLKEGKLIFRPENRIFYGE